MIKNKKKKYETLNILNKAESLINKKEVWLPFLFYVRRLHILNKKYNILNGYSINIYFNYITNKFTYIYIINQTINIGSILTSDVNSMYKESDKMILERLIYNINIKQKEKEIYAAFLNTKSTFSLTKEEILSYNDKIDLIKMTEVIKTLNLGSVNQDIDFIAFKSFLKYAKEKDYIDVLLSEKGINRDKNRIIFNKIVKHAEKIPNFKFKNIQFELFNNGDHIFRRKNEVLALNLKGGTLMNDTTIHNNFYYIDSTTLGNTYNYIINKSAELLIIDIDSISELKNKIRLSYEQEKIKNTKDLNSKRLETLRMLNCKLNNNDYFYLKSSEYHSTEPDYFSSNGLIINKNIINHI